MSKYLFAGQGILGLEQQWFLFYIFSSKQTYPQGQQQIKDNPKENIYG